MRWFLIGILSIAASAQAETFDGTWVQACQGSAAREEKFAGDTALYTEKTFAEPNCQELSLELVSQGSFQLGALPGAPRGAHAADFTFGIVTLVLHTEPLVADYNARSVCGFRNWAIHEGKDITGRECDFFGLGSVIQVPELGDKRFGLLAREGSSIFLGKISLEKNGLTPEARPLELDPIPYVRACGKFFEMSGSI